MKAPKKPGSKPSREEYQNKKVSPKKSSRGQAENEYGEVKETTSFCITPTSVEWVKTTAKTLTTSHSDVVEKVLRKFSGLSDGELIAFENARNEEWLRHRLGG